LSKIFKSNEIRLINEVLEGCAKVFGVQTSISGGSRSYNTWRDNVITTCKKLMEVLLEVMENKPNFLR